ncbi:MAG: DUF1684 domain-containing protein [Bryobacteraceae bacterium]
MRSILCAILTAACLTAFTYDQDIETWRQTREASLKADDGWLTVAGLFWLHEGENTVGSDPASAIVLPRGPSRFGVFEFHGGKTSFRPASLVAGDAPMMFHTDTSSEPEQVRSGDFTMFVIHRGSRYAVRLKDKQSEFRKSFTGLHWYPVRADYRIVAKWVPYPEPKTMAVPNILGETTQEPSPGYAEFELHGKQYQLHPVLEGKQLFFIFRDLTSGKETYPPGRFLYSDLPAGGHVILDFNKAYNPPCAFTPYATCPLPPPQNRLAARIEAGELNYGKHA